MEELTAHDQESPKMSKLMLFHIFLSVFVR